MFRQNITDIILAAATSSLGIFALMLCAIAILALTFFRSSSESIKVTIFLFLLAGVSVFGYSISEQTGRSDTIVIPKNTIVKKDEKPQIDKEIRVPGNKQWTPTKLNVELGTKVEFVAEGQVILTEKQGNIPKGTSTPDGVTNKKWIKKYSFPFKGKNTGALIGRISDNGRIFLIGKSASIIAEKKGEIYLGINDKELSDNHGAYDVKITVYSGQ